LLQAEWLYGLEVLMHPTDSSSSTWQSAAPALYTVNPTATVRAMGNDLVVVSETQGWVAVLNSTAVTVFSAIHRGEDANQMRQTLKRSTLVTIPDDEVDKHIDDVVSDLIDSRVLVPKRAYEQPAVSVTKLSEALNNMDLTRAHVTAYE
jgi:hypothetical protein